MKPQHSFGQTIAAPLAQPNDKPKSNKDNVIEMPTARDSKTAVPNFLITFVLGILVALVVFAYDAIRREIAEVKDRTQSNEYRYQILRERLAAHGWVFDKDGNIISTPMDNKPDDRKGKK
jgi:hypothetical protein